MRQNFCFRHIAVLTAAKPHVDLLSVVYRRARYGWHLCGGDRIGRGAMNLPSQVGYDLVLCINYGLT